MGSSTSSGQSSGLSEFQFAYPDILPRGDAKSEALGDLQEGAPAARVHLSRAQEHRLRPWPVHTISCPGSKCQPLSGYPDLGGLARKPVHIVGRFASPNLGPPGILPGCRLLQVVDKKTAGDRGLEPLTSPVCRRQRKKLRSKK